MEFIKVNICGYGRFLSISTQIGRTQNVGPEGFGFLHSREIISHNGGPRGCADVVPPTNGDLPFGQLVDFNFNHAINTNLTLVWIYLTILPLKTKTKVKPLATLTQTINQTKPTRFHYKRIVSLPPLHLHPEC